MKTLYDFLGALPDDDAESLRAAFRVAAKGAHPDLNPGDPDAALRFRQLVRANEILADEKQRATYDRLLHLARVEQKEARGHAATAAINRIAISAAYVAIALAGVLSVAVAGHKLVLLVNGTPSAAAQISQVSGREPAQAAAVTTGVSDARAFETPDRHDKPEAVDAPKKFDERVQSSQQEAAPALTAPAQAAAITAATADVPVTGEVTTKDAEHYRVQGIRAYRSGDLYIALVDFDLAIQLDPGFSEAYIDRAIVFYRMGDQKRAFADIAQARRIHQESSRKRMLPAASAR
jgi:curved DNA-binding protein CbpA